MRVKSGITILLNTATNTTFLATDLDEQVQTGTRENDKHIEWCGELSINPVKYEKEKYAALVIDWYKKLRPIEKCTVHHPHSGPGLYELSSEDMVKKFNTHLSAIEAEKERGKG